MVHVSRSRGNRYLCEVLGFRKHCVGICRQHVEAVGAQQNQLKRGVHECLQTDV
ncbi:protein suppressor of phya-105 1 [Phtheirospermum japonicum]|uniref:Protein suppressor of phya-105 1 n=1 Tax=Phtheirospermum japonicum TaxID=374723 RepID=A0A830CDY1_9LAMI|nr:protein suppressor of phya-105 1 [Phtheirospermum japonicum]